MSFKNNIINIHGNKGKKWLTNLPKLVEKFTLKYRLSDLKPIDNLTYNYVSSGIKNDRSIILKLGPDIEALMRESDALKAFKNYGAVLLLAQEDGMLLLDCAKPGNSLKTYLNDGKKDEALGIICKILRKLHQVYIPKNHSFPNIT